MSSLRALTPFIRAPPSNLITYQRPQLPLPSYWGVGFNMLILGDTHFLSMTFYPLVPQIHVLFLCEVHSFHPNSPQTLNSRSGINFKAQVQSLV